MQYTIEFVNEQRVIEKGVMIQIVQTHDGWTQQAAVVITEKLTIINVPLSNVRVIDNKITEAFE